MPGIHVRRATGRFSASNDWLESRRSFSFEQDYDPDNTSHGVLVAHNEDVVAPRSGYNLHPHRDLEIVTWVLRGSLVHHDSAGHSGTIYPGLAQRMSAGTGIQHSERNDSADVHDPVRFVQMWVAPDEPGLPPGYEHRELGEDLDSGLLVPVASGLARHHDAAVRINNQHAALHVARLQPGEQVTLPDAPYLHLFVAEGAVELEGSDSLDRGDAARLTDAGARTVTAAVDGTGDVSGHRPGYGSDHGSDHGSDDGTGGTSGGTSGYGAEILVWEMHADLRV